MTPNETMVSDVAIGCGACQYYKATPNPLPGPLGHDGHCENMLATLGQRGIRVSRLSNVGCKFFKEQKVQAMLKAGPTAEDKDS